MNEESLASIEVQKPKRRPGLYTMMALTLAASVGSCTYNQLQFQILYDALQPPQEQTTPSYTELENEANNL